jgi:hypothetical protein
LTKSTQEGAKIQQFRGKRFKTTSLLSGEPLRGLKIAVPLTIGCLVFGAFVPFAFLRGLAPCRFISVHQRKSVV